MTVTTRPSPFAIAPFGFDGRGYSTEGDAINPRVDHTLDGVDLNTLWTEHAAVLQTWNSRASSLAALLSYWHTNAADAIPDKFLRNTFEPASKFGEPVGVRGPDYQVLGYDFEDYDTASRYTWKFLRDATSDQVKAILNDVLAADNRLVNDLILRRLFDPTETVNEQGTPVYGLYNGDGTVPPPFAGKTFTGTETHYLTTGHDDLDSGDVEQAIRIVRDKGFGIPESGQKLLMLCHPNQAETVASWAKGIENANEAVAKYDALPSVGAPAFEASGPIVGSQAPAELFGVDISGSYGPVYVADSYFIPQGWFAVVATAGPNNPMNPIGVRQHPDGAYQGLRAIPGPVPGWPLQDAFYTRGIGVGTRHRGAAVVYKIGSGGQYTAPNLVV
jgi:hypothetical protein